MVVEAEDSWGGHAPAVAGARLRICTLGPLQVDVDGVATAVHRPIERLVLGALATARGAYVDLIDVAPPDRDRTAARRAMATTVWRLRQTLGAAADVIMVDGRPARYALDPRRTEFVTATFDALRRDGRDRLLGDDPAGAADALTRAMALWRGEAMDGLGEHRSIRAERVYLDELRLGALEDLATALVRAARPVEALQHLARLLQEQPLHEQAWALRIRALIDAGRPDDAAGAYDEARARLAETGLEPGLALRRAADPLAVEPVPALRIAPMREAGAPIRRPGVFVGRDREVALLGDLVTGPAPASGLALVLGSPGTGKTRLAAEVAARAGPDRATYYVSIGGGRDPFAPLVELARMLVADAPPEVGRDPEVARLLDPTDRALQPREVTAADPQEAYLDGLCDLLHAACPTGALVVVDDAHVASAAMLGLLRRLAEGAVRRPIVVLALVRTPVREVEVLASAEQLATAVIHLGGLDSTDVQTLAASMAGSAALAPDQLRWIEEQTAGNPLFVSVLLGDAEVRRALAAGTLPARRDGLHHAVARFLSGVAAPDREVLRGLAFLGSGTFDRALVAEVCAGRGIGPDLVGAALDRAIARSILFADPGVLEVVTFAHGLIRDALVDEVDPSERPRWHRACAEAVERRAAHDPSLVHAVAGHHARAWPHTSAVDAATWLAASATAMSRLADHAAAAAQLETAATLLGRDAAAPVRLVVDVQLSLARARIDVADLERAFGAIRTAAHVARRAGWADGVAMAAIRGADVVDPDGQWRDELVELLVEAVGAEPLDARLRGKALTALGYLRPGLADRLTAQAVERTRLGGSHADLATLLIDLWLTVDADHQLEVAEEVAALGESIGAARIEAIGLLRRWQSAIRVGRATFEDPVADRVARLVDEADDPLLDWNWLSWSAVRAIAVGDFDRADELVTRTLRLPMHLGREPLAPPSTRLLSLSAAQRGLLGFLRNDPSAMQYAVRAAATNWSIAGLDQRWLGSLRHATDAPTTGHPSLDDLTSGLRAMVRPTPERVLAAALLGDGAGPIGHRPGIDAAREVMLQHTGEHLVFEHVYFGTVDQHLGWIDMYTGELDAAIGRFDAALARLHEVGSLPFVVRINRNLAAVLRGRGADGDQRRADLLEAEASQIADRLGVLGGAYRPPLSQE